MHLMAFGFRLTVGVKEDEKEKTPHPNPPLMSTWGEGIGKLDRSWAQSECSESCKCLLGR